MSREGEVIGIMMEWDITAIKKIPLDGYMFCGKEEHFPVSSLREVLADYMEGYHIDHFEMGYLERE